ncbi:MAG: hypothetical protein ABIR18_13345 [Chitinophagaceae bacterium]
MADLNIIRENYAKMPDKELLRFAKEEGKDLTDEALVLLEKEFTYRNFDKTIFNTIREKESDIQESEDEAGLFNTMTGAADLTGGLTYQEMMYPKEKESIAQSQEKFIAGLTDENALTLIKKCESSMMKNGAIAVIGLIITGVTLKMAENGGSYVVAWGAIIFGAIGFFRAVNTRDKIKSALKAIPESKQQSINDPQENNDI